MLRHRRTQQRILFSLLLLLGGVAVGATQWAYPEHRHRALFSVPAVSELSQYRQRSVFPSIATVDLVGVKPGGGFAATTAGTRRGMPVGCKVVWKGKDKAWVAVNFRPSSLRRDFYVYYGGKNGPGMAEFPTNVPALPVQVIRHKTDTFTPPPAWRDMLHIFAAREGTYSASSAASLFYQRYTGAERRSRAKREVVVMRSHVVCPKDGKYSFGVKSSHGGSLLIDGNLAVHSRSEKGAHAWIEGKSIELAAGPHLLEVYALLPTETSGVRVGWRVPGLRSVTAIPDSALLPGNASALVRVENWGQKINVGFTSRRRDSYSFRGIDTVLVPVWLSSALIGVTNKSAGYRWDYGDGRAEDENVTQMKKNTHHYYHGGKVYTPTLVVTDEEGLSWHATREIDLRNVDARRNYDVSVELKGLPAVCYPDDKIEASLRFEGELPRYFSARVDWKIKMADGRERSRMKIVNPVDSDRIEPLILLDSDAGDLRVVEWRVDHHGVILAEERIEFARPPFEHLPATAGADRIYRADGVRQVLVPDRSKGATRGDPGGATLWVDDFMMDSLDDEDEERLGGLLAEDCRCVSLVTGKGQASTALEKLVAFADSLDGTRGPVVVSLGRTDMGLRTPYDVFERHVAAISEMVMSKKRRSVLWITPPAYPSEGDVVRGYAAAVMRAALSRGVTAVDLYTPFMCEGEKRRLLFSASPMVLSKRGMELVARIVNSQLSALGNANVDSE